MANLIHNERVKLRAGLFNAAAGSCFTVGIAAPIAAGLFYGASNIPLRAIVAGVIFWLAAAGTCHWLALRALRGLRTPMTDIQWFAFVILPVAVIACGWAYELLAERADRR